MACTAAAWATTQTVSVADPDATSWEVRMVPINSATVADTVMAAMVVITDITATCLDVAGQAYPKTFHDRKVTPLAGRSLLPVLKTGTREQRESLCWSTSGAKAVRMGSWKLVALPKGPWELYDLSVDRTELNDLAKQQPERVAEMEQAFNTWKQQ